MNNYKCRIEKLERGSRSIKGGTQTQTGLWCVLTNLETGNERKDFLHEKFNANLIQALEAAGVGATVDAAWKKNGAYLNLNYVGNAVPGNTGSVPPTTPAAPPQQSSAATTQPKAVDNGRKTAKQLIREASLRMATTVGTSMLDNADAGKFFPKTKTTPELFLDFIFGTADQFVAYINDEKKSDSKSESSDLKEDPVDAKEVDLPIGEDVSPPPPSDEDDIPF